VLEWSPTLPLIHVIGILAAARYSDERRHGAVRRAADYREVSCSVVDWPYWYERSRIGKVNHRQPGGEASAPGSLEDVLVAAR
jgi:hypothetical protein